MTTTALSTDEIRSTFFAVDELGLTRVRLASRLLHDGAPKLHALLVAIVVEPQLGDIPVPLDLYRAAVDIRSKLATEGLGAAADAALDHLQNVDGTSLRPPYGAFGRLAARPARLDAVRFPDGLLELSFDALALSDPDKARAEARAAGLTREAAQPPPDAIPPVATDLERQQTQTAESHASPQPAHSQQDGSSDPFGGDELH